ncbi:MAG: cysteine synthase family protein [Thermoleophilia bacterium]|nr:cysteine synthase family protein [Thermoleophilia bacterium]
MRPLERPARGILDTIGSTPLVDVSELLDRRRAAPGVRLLAKLEGANPSGSVKDRIALRMVLDARARGELPPGRTMIEPTSGNTGIALALVGTLLGNPVRVVLPDNATPERIRMLETFGAQVTFSPGQLGSNGAVQLACEIAAGNPDLYMPMQYANECNPLAHYEGTAAELIDQVGMRIHAFVAGLGTGGTLTGIGRRLHEHDARISIVAAEPRSGDAIMGLRSIDDGYVPPILDLDLIDRRVYITHRHSIIGTRALASVGVFAGVSSGAAIQVARIVANEAPRDTCVIALCADSGWKYLSARLHDRPLDDLEDHMDAGHWW